MVLSLSNQQKQNIMESNAKLIRKIDQELHNSAIKHESRFDALLEFLQNKNQNLPITNKRIDELFKEIDFSDKDIVQDMFMLFGNQFTKYKLDQFYTPLTISQFICSLMLPGKKAIDPAGGTGDLLLYYTQGDKTIWDIDSNVLKLCKFNFELNQLKNYHLECKNSLADLDNHIAKYDYVVMNPPFGSKTVETDPTILESFCLGKGKKKQELGILFLELGMKLLRENGILFIILPSGYMGNKNNAFVELRTFILENTVLAVVELPSNTFKRSGTGVNTYLLILQKAPAKPQYEILISGIENIGYNLTKKETPRLYKTNPANGEIIRDNNKVPILENDLTLLLEQFTWFAKKNNIPTVSSSNTPIDYESVDITQLDSNILDIKRYKQNYLLVIKNLKETGSFQPVNKFAKIITTSSKIEKTKLYKYIDIGEINSPLHNYKNLYGWELPSRAKCLVQKYDILVSKLEGTMSYCVILNDFDNMIATNGVAVIRPTSMSHLYTLFSNIMKKDFAIQHNAFVTGSIMASLNDADVGSILVSTKEDNESTKKIIDTLELLQNLRFCTY